MGHVPAIGKAVFKQSGQKGIVPTHPVPVPPVGAGYPLTLQHKAAAMAATGIPIVDIAAVLGVNTVTIWRWLKLEENKQIVEDIRSAMKAEVIKRASPVAQAVLDKLMKGVDGTEMTPTEIDALSRAALNLEKIAASNAGDNRIGRPGAAPREVTVTFAPGWGPDIVEAEMVAGAITEGAPVPEETPEETPETDPAPSAS